MPATLSLSLGGMEPQLRIVAALKRQSQSAYIRDLLKAAIEREAAKSAALAELLKAA